MFHSDLPRPNSQFNRQYLSSTSRIYPPRVLRSQQDLEDFFENGVIGLRWVASILRANQAELDLLGYTREEYVGRHIANFHADRAIIDDILARLSGGEKLDKFPPPHMHRPKPTQAYICLGLLNNRKSAVHGRFIAGRTILP